MRPRMPPSTFFACTDISYIAEPGWALYLWERGSSTWQECLQQIYVAGHLHLCMLHRPAVGLLITAVLMSSAIVCSILSFRLQSDTLHCSLAMHSCGPSCLMPQWHNMPESCWVIVDRQIYYDATSVLLWHPATVWRPFSSLQMRMLRKPLHLFAFLSFYI